MRRTPLTTAPATPPTKERSTAAIVTQHDHREYSRPSVIQGVVEYSRTRRGRDSHQSALQLLQPALSPCTHTHPFNGPLSGTTQVSRYQKGKTNLDFTEPRDIGWQWLQLGYMQVCTSLQTDNHTSTPPLSFLQAGCPSCRPTNSVKALNAVLDN